jgi:putative acetyltransferase
VVRIDAVEGRRDLATVGRLFREYERSLDTDLRFQGFAAELRALPGEYVPPGGALFLGRVDGVVAGCVALRPGPRGAAELKRLFVRRRFRGVGLGRALVTEAMRAARAVPYRAIVLDTLPEMADARRLYLRLGFRECAAYGGPSVPGMRYFRLLLASAR